MLVAVNLGLVRGPGGVDIADIVRCPRGVKIAARTVGAIADLGHGRALGSALKQTVLVQGLFSSSVARNDEVTCGSLAVELESVKFWSLLRGVLTCSPSFFPLIHRDSLSSDARIRRDPRA